MPPKQTFDRPKAIGIIADEGNPMSGTMLSAASNVHPVNSLEKKIRILLVEDHAPTRNAMTQLMRQAGAEVVSARDGEEGLALLLTQHFDVLLTDLRMPVMDGFELLQQCMKLPETHRPGRIIAISGEYEASALKGRPVSYLPKPFDLNALLDMIGGKPN